MIGLIFLLLLFLLIFTINFFAKRIAEEVCEDGTPKQNKRKYWSVIAFCVFALVGDEILGGTQLAYFCLSEPKIKLLVSDAKGRRVMTPTTTYLAMNSSILEVKKGIRRLVDVNSQELITSGFRYKSKWGWLSRTIAFNDSKNPLLFNGICSNNKVYYGLVAANGMTLIR